MKTLNNLLIAVAVIAWAATSAIGQPPPPSMPPLPSMPPAMTPPTVSWPVDTDGKLKLSENMKTLIDALKDNGGTNITFVHNQYSLSVFVPANRLTKDMKKMLVKVVQENDDEDPPAEIQLKHIKGVVLSCYKQGNAFTHALVTFDDPLSSSSTAPQKRSVGASSPDLGAQTDSAIQEFLLAANAGKLLNANGLPDRLR